MGGAERGLTEQWHQVGDHAVRSLTAGTPADGTPEVVLVPGLGALGYLAPLARACASWTRVHLLDVPGFGLSATAGRPADLASVAAVVGGWVTSVPTAPVLLAGHSTGAQAALVAAGAHPDAVRALVLGGVTFPPEARTLPRVAWRVARFVVHEQPAQLPAVLPYYLRGARRLPELLRSARQDRPEDRVPQLEAPLVVVRGRYDALCPPGWAADLADAAPVGRCVELPGAHNAWWTVPDAASAVLREAAAGR